MHMNAGTHRDLRHRITLGLESQGFASCLMWVLGTGRAVLDP